MLNIDLKANKTFGLTTMYHYAYGENPCVRKTHLALHLMRFKKEKRRERKKTQQCSTEILDVAFHHVQQSFCSLITFGIVFYHLAKSFFELMDVVVFDWPAVLYHKSLTSLFPSFIML